ncbi:MAG: MFS transporter, partial [Actinomycetota bacterium]|nr:MFS transporter [Actinomycetota bacterium]
MKDWRRVSLSLFVVAFGTNVSTPLLLVYRERLHLSDAVLTAIFGAYAAGLVPAILFSGPLSDRLGRRRVTVPFVALAAVSTALFVPAADAEWLLYVARFLQGVVSGVVFSVATAWLAELSGPDGHQAAGRRAAVAMTMGFSLGPLTSGALGQWAPAPTVLPYVVHLVLLVAAVLVLVGVPETLAARATGPLLRIRLRPGTARTFWLLVAPTAVCVYGFPSVAITVVPLSLPQHAHQVAFTGLVGGLTLGSGTVAALWAGPLGSRAAAVGVTTGALGYAACAV